MENVLLLFEWLSLGGGKVQSEEWQVQRQRGVLCVFCCIMKQQKNQKIRKERCAEEIRQFM